MGSQSSHFAHPEGNQHRFDGGNQLRGRCGMCSEPITLGVEAYHCTASACGFVLHADCYSRPEKIKDHFAHPGHPLTLSRDHQQLAAGRQCNICAVAFNARGGPSYFVYGCGRCHGFYAHPRCAALPRTVLNQALHLHTLTLLPPPRWPVGAGGRRCVNAAGGCQNATQPLATDALSYQCNLCNVEVCLKCQLPAAAGPDDDPHQCCGCADVRGTAHQVGTAIGTSLRAIGCACLGVQTHPPPAAAA